uniref:WAP domain-containing protein n=1 Tax=Plectus sambesii TaxID=2011161 RepID=A0A914V0Z6_9BILA
MSSSPMFLITFLIGILASARSTTISSSSVCQGRANEFYSSCSSPCQPTCANPRPSTCTTSCLAQCVCAAGYVRDMQRTNRPCVLPQQCSNLYRNCPANERYLTCGPACQATCSNRNPPCQRNCVNGCFCQPGYVRNSNNVCVMSHSCSAASSKSGSCPPLPIVTTPSVTVCNNDFNCPGIQKCCSQTPAGRRICSAVVQTGK